MAYAQILVHIDTSGGFQEYITIQWRNFSHRQNLDYEGVPFKCRRYHKVGHLFKDFPLNKNSKNSDGGEVGKTIPPKSNQNQGKWVCNSDEGKQSDPAPIDQSLS